MLYPLPRPRASPVGVVRPTPLSAIPNVQGVLPVSPPILLALLLSYRIRSPRLIGPRTRSLPQAYPQSTLSLAPLAKQHPLLPLVTALTRVRATTLLLGSPAPRPKGLILALELLLASPKTLVFPLESRATLLLLLL